MKKYTWILVIMLFLSPVLGFSQNEEWIKEQDEVYTIVEQMPEMPGGRGALYAFLSKNVKYPLKAKSKGIQGKVFVNFTVSKDGTLRDIKIIRGVHKLLDKEALRVIKSMPTWKPGMQRGKKVSVSYNLPISFVLKKKSKHIHEKLKQSTFNLRP